jgi:flavodoxin I
MDLMNYKMKVAIIYSSVTGNTKELAEELYQILLEEVVDVSIFRIEKFPLSLLCKYDVVMIGTYSWGNGEIPKEMWDLYQAFELRKTKDITTAVFGTGDSFYPKFCGAVDQFRDMLYVHTSLVATLKVELLPQKQDLQRCRKLVETLLRRASIRNQIKIESET